MSENRTAAARVNIFMRLALALVIFLSLNVLGNALLGPVRFDLTGDRLFTLSPGTKSILGDLERPLTLRYYFSKNAAAADPELYRYGRRVQDFLEEFEALSNGAIDLQVIDPEPFSTDKEEAEAYGLLNIGEGDDNPLYMGLVGFDDTNRLEVIGVFSEERERFLEFDLAKIVYLLALEQKPKLGLITTLPMRYGLGGAMGFLQGQSQSYILYSQLAQFFDLKFIEPGFTALPDGLDVLMLVHPPGFTDSQLFAIDQFVISGKPALVFVDPFSETSLFNGSTGAYGVGAAVPERSDLHPLLEAWGVDYSPDIAVVDLELGQRVSVGQGDRATVQDYVHWLGIDGGHMNENDPVTAFLSTVNFASSGVLSSSGKSGLDFEKLVWTSDNSAQVDAALVRGDFDPVQLMREAVPDGSHTLIARVTGRAESIFPDGFDGHPAIKAGDIKVIVGADADIFEDRFWAAFRTDQMGQSVLVPIADNATLIVNAIDHLSGSEGLVSLRARGVSKKPLETFQAMRDEATRLQEAEHERLSRRLAEVQARLKVLEASAAAGRSGDEAGEADIIDFRNEARTIERNLNEVERNLRANIQSLENRIVFLNLFVIPALLILISLVLWMVRRRRAS